jgi:hypothetical protein
MTAAVERFPAALLTLVPDALIVLVLVFPGMAAYLRWPLLGIYVAVSWHVLAKARAHSWILTIVRDPATRITHGLEHATLAVLWEDELPASHGFTHASNRFVVALDGKQDHQLAAVRDAAARAIHRVRNGELALAYQPGCGTSEAVSAVSLWLVLASSLVCSLAIGGSQAIFLALCVIVFRIWGAFETGLGLLAQRLFTVSTAFSSAIVVEATGVSTVCGHVCPEDETWFEVVVEIQSGAKQGGLVSPGVLG